jgi:hypothetical protein
MKEEPRTVILHSVLGTLSVAEKPWTVSLNRSLKWRPRCISIPSGQLSETVEDLKEPMMLRGLKYHANDCTTEGICTFYFRALGRKGDHPEHARMLYMLRCCF